MSRPDEHSVFCSECGCYNIDKIYCEDCVKEKIREVCEGLNKWIENHKRFEVHHKIMLGNKLKLIEGEKNA